MVMKLWHCALLIAAASDSQLAAAGQSAAAAPPAAAWTYADLADLSLTAPVAAHVRVRRAVALKPAEAGNVGAGRTRFYVVADLVALIRGAEGLPRQVSYLADVSNEGGKAPRIRKNSEYIVLARTVPGKAGELQLVAPNAQLPFTPDRADTLRSIMRDAAAADAPPRITGIGRAFHTPGTVPGESETQIFLQTADNRPVSLSILRRPGATPQWAVALSEVTDDAAAPPPPNSLLWYRLACTLPPALPDPSLAEAPEHADAIRADYQLVIAGLGRCARTRS